MVDVQYHEALRGIAALPALRKQERERDGVRPAAYGKPDTPWGNYRPVYLHCSSGISPTDKKYPGFLTNEAVIVGVESRSSSAVRIVRDAETMQSVSTPNLYPCGEGAGYAGGITSSALDGINAALAIIRH